MKKKALINRNNITNHLIEYQLEIVGKTLIETMDDDKWFFNWTMTRVQYEEFHLYSIPLLKKIFKFNKARAEATFKWFYEAFGLRIKN